MPTGSPAFAATYHPQAALLLSLAGMLGSVFGWMVVEQLADHLVRALRLLTPRGRAQAQQERAELEAQVERMMAALRASAARDSSASQLQSWHAPRWSKWLTGIALVLALVFTGQRARADLVVAQSVVRMLDEQARSLGPSGWLVRASIHTLYARENLDRARARVQLLDALAGGGVVLLLLHAVLPASVKQRKVFR